MTPLRSIPLNLVELPGHQPAPPPRRSTCAAPGCRRTAAERHHAVARSFQRRLLGHVFDYLILDGKMSLVLVDLCHAHHDRLESGWGGCKSRLRWASGWAWYDRTDGVIVDGKPRIYYYDARNSSYWIMKGFCKGEYVCN